LLNFVGPIRTSEQLGLLAWGDELRISSAVSFHEERFEHAVELGPEGITPHMWKQTVLRTPLEELVHAELHPARLPDLCQLIARDEGLGRKNYCLRDVGARWIIGHASNTYVLFTFVKAFRSMW